MKTSQKVRILQLLEDGQFHRMDELNAICYRYSARLHDLSKDGIEHQIKTKNGVNYYRLIPEGQNEHLSERKIDCEDRPETKRDSFVQLQIC